MRSTIQEVGTLLIGGLAFLMMMALYARISTTAFTQTTTTAVHEGNTSSTQVIERELRGIGFGVPDSNSVLQADSTVIVFRSDLNANGSVDTVTYALGTPNASGKRSLIRTVHVNGTSASMPIASSIAAFRFTYRDSSGGYAANATTVRSITLAMLMEGDISIDGDKSGVYWERTFKPNNLR